MDPIERQLSKLVVEATNLRDEARLLNIHAVELYEKVIDVALAVKYPAPKIPSRIVLAYEEERNR